ncbi:hypothetical protein [Actinokineospora terrae]|uniref:hypothetical protein n=1 Tax=Actinokineospora terrae TaxID=155974 RepID=UPI0015A6838F|nr:hypothetical protein [Actinokineospora terrae]
MTTRNSTYVYDDPTGDNHTGDASCGPVRTFSWSTISNGRYDSTHASWVSTDKASGGTC